MKTKNRQELKIYLKRLNNNFKMIYFFELGNNPSLSVAEIAAVFGMKENYRLIGGKILLIEDSLEFDASSLIKKMGGVIKIGVIKEQNIQKAEINSCLLVLENLIKDRLDKICFGISFYGRKKLNIKHLGMDIKTFIKERGKNCRWVSAKENILSSVIVEQNRLITKGFELIIIEDGNNFLLGHTLAVQPFKELSGRDYGRPARDDHSGMLPPKLAQIMINLSCANLSDKFNRILLDPFCGSGTIVTEAMLMGYKNILGSDLSPKAVLDTKKNMDWIIKHNQELTGDRTKNISIKKIDVKSLSQYLKSKSIDAIATEPYLGPQRGLNNIMAIKKELEDLYKEALRQFKNVLKPKARVVMIFPIFNQGQKMQFLNVDISGFKIINPLPNNFINNNFLKLSFRKTIVYGREGQRVWREIVVLEVE